jgi:histidinol phosphatase-like enzyme
VFLDRDGTLVEEVAYLHDLDRVVLLPGVGSGLRRLAAAGVRLDAVLHCPHHPEGTVPGYARVCRCRKPGPGMLEAAAERLGLDLAASWLIGNHPADVGAAVAAGVRPLFVTTGRAAGRPPSPGVAAVADLEAAAPGRARSRRGAAADMAEGQTRPGRDGAGLTRDAGWSRATAPLTGTSSGWSDPPDPPIPRAVRCSPSSPCRFRRAPPAVSAGTSLEDDPSVAPATRRRRCPGSPRPGDLRHTRLR